MVLLAAAVCNKAGKVIISRQFVEMTRSRVEGLLAAFPKLMNTGKQHTFVETESVRYVYQPMEKLYMVLITTKASNILEDLETLRLFARTVPEYCKVMEDSEILEQSFQLIFAFDEIVALGYRENVNLAQIRTFTEMDSHEEKVFQAVRMTQEREQREHMKRMAKELQQSRKATGMGGKRMTGISSMGSQGFGRSDSSSMMDTSPVEPSKPSYTAPKPTPSGKAMKLGSKAKDVDMFVDQLKSEGEIVTSGANKSASASKVTTPAINQEPVHIHAEEKISLTAGRDGGLRNLEVQGMVSIRITENSFDRIKILVVNNDKNGVLLQPHPNVDKKMFQASSVLQLKNPSKPFPLNQDAGILKWRFQTQDDSFIPFSINCWPNESGTGCDVNIEYELERSELELNNVVISIPLPSGVGAPVVNECDGEYHYESRKGLLEWTLPVIDQSNKSGSMEFSINGHPDDFFPVNVSFTSNKTFCDILMAEVRQVEGEASVKFSSDCILQTEKYEIV